MVIKILTMNSNNICSYFPCMDNAHQKKREFFVDYGSPWFIDCNVENDLNESNNADYDDCTLDDKDISKCIKFFSQRQLKCSNSQFSLVAKDPSLPLVFPNKCIQDRCMFRIRKDIKNADRMLEKLLIFKRLVSKENMPFKDIISNYLWEYETKVKKLLLVKTGETEDVMVDLKLRTVQSYFNKHSNPFMRNVKNLAVFNKKEFGNEDLVYKKTVNSKFSGGCLSYESLTNYQNNNNNNYQHNNNQKLIDSGFLVYPSGSSMNEIVFTEGFHSTDNRFSLNMNNSKCYSLESPIYQVDSCMVQGKHYVLSRQLEYCKLWQVNRSFNELRPEKILNFKLDDQSDTISFVNLSPFIANESLFSTRKGQVYLMNCEYKPNSIYTFEAYKRDNWNSCMFSGHPRKIILSQRNQLSSIDIRNRISQTKPSSSLLSLPINLLNSNEQIMVHKIYQHDSYYHVIGTECSLIVLDERFPNHLVLKWNHCLLTPPQYLNITTNVMSSPGEDLILLGSQEHGEVHCFQAHHLMPSSEKPPQACENPWMASKTIDFALLMSQNGKCLLTSDLEKRLKLPLIGIGCARNDKSQALSILQLTSVGDIFGQDYDSISRIKKKEDKTLGAGASSKKLNFDFLEKESRSSYCREWVRRAVLLGESVNGNLDNFVVNNDDDVDGTIQPTNQTQFNQAYELFRDISLEPKSKSLFCSLCNLIPKDYSGNDANELCPACEFDLLTTQRLVQSIEKDIIITEPSEFKEEKDLNCILENLCDYNYEDVDTNLLIKQYYQQEDEEGIYQLILKRDEEIVREYRDLLQKNKKTEKMFSSSVNKKHKQLSLIVDEKILQVGESIVVLPASIVEDCKNYSLLSGTSTEKKYVGKKGINSDEIITVEEDIEYLGEDGVKKLNHSESKKRIYMKEDTKPGNYADSKNRIYLEENSKEVNPIILEDSLLEFDQNPSIMLTQKNNEFIIENKIDNSFSNKSDDNDNDSNNCEVEGSVNKSSDIYTPPSWRENIFKNDEIVVDVNLFNKVEILTNNVAFEDIIPTCRENLLSSNSILTEENKYNNDSTNLDNLFNNNLKVISENNNNIFDETQKDTNTDIRIIEIDDTNQDMKYNNQQKINDDTKKDIFIETQQDSIFNDTCKDIFNDTLNDIFNDNPKYIFNDTSKDKLKDTQKDLFNNTQKDIFKDNQKDIFNDSYSDILNEIPNNITHYMHEDILSRTDRDISDNIQSDTYKDLHKNISDNSQLLKVPSGQSTNQKMRTPKAKKIRIAGF